MEYKVSGDGFPLVMIMGLGATLDWWEPAMVEELSKQHKTIIFDNRGIGQTDKPDMKYSIKMFAADTVNLMSELEIERAHVLGISMGGMIAQEVALSYPERVEKLVLCSTAASIPWPLKLLARLFAGAYKGRMKTPEKTREMLISGIFSKDFIKANPDKIERVKQRAFKITPIFDEFKCQLQATMGFDSRKRLKNINKPVFIMHGKLDSLISYKASLQLVQLIPYSKLMLFEKTAHALFSQEPEKTIKPLLEFLT